MLETPSAGNNNHACAQQSVTTLIASACVKTTAPATWNEREKHQTDGKESSNEIGRPATNAMMKPIQFNIPIAHANAHLEINVSYCTNGLICCRAVTNKNEERARYPANRRRGITTRTVVWQPAGKNNHNAGSKLTAIPLASAYTCTTVITQPALATGLTKRGRRGRDRETETRKQRMAGRGRVTRMAPVPSVCKFNVDPAGPSLATLPARRCG